MQVQARRACLLQADENALSPAKPGPGGLLPPLACHASFRLRQRHCQHQLPMSASCQSSIGADAGIIQMPAPAQAPTPAHSNSSAKGSA